MFDYSIVSRFRNKEQVELLVDKIKARGKTCYNFCAKPADPSNPDAHPEDQMRAWESTPDFVNHPYFREIFETDLSGLKEAQAVILLLPAGTSAHIEIGIAYGLGKKCILIGEPEKPESLYLIFDERYQTIDEFIASI